MFSVHRFPSGACEIRFDFHDDIAQDIPPLERRAFMSLGPSLHVVNVWLSTLAADVGYATGTGYEYAKVCAYVLKWLVQRPVSLTTREPIGSSLLTLKRTDVRALLAWLTLPAEPAQLRASLVRTGILPAGYRTYALAPATRNFRIAALSAFYDWLLTEYMPTDGIVVGITENPFKRVERPRTFFQEARRPDGILPNTLRREQTPSQLFRRQQDKTGPTALTVPELQQVLAALPLVSHGRNAANRNGALVRLMLWGMLREAEAVGVVWEAVDDETLWVHGKGGKYRAVPITDKRTWSYLHTYTNELHIPLEQRFHGACFRQLDHDDRPITKHTIEHLLLSLRAYFRERADAARRQGETMTAQALEHLLGKLHSHIFRATGATLMAAAGMSLITLSMLLGHADPGTTQRYYLAAEQLVLPETVRTICAQISVTLEKVPSYGPGNAPLDTLQWYRRRGLLPQERG